jgi:RNA polymerase sigma-70 factor (ECF subfamily)
MSVINEEREKKFIAIYRTYVDEIYQYLYLRTGLHPSVAEDLAQEVFVAVFRELSRFKGLCTERTWIFKIAKNKLNDYYRKQYSPKFEMTDLDDDLAEQLDDTSQDVQELMIESFERERVRACMQGLREQYRIVLILKYIDGRSVKDIAFTIEKSPKAVESILQRAKHAFIRGYTLLDDRGAIR